MQELSAWKGVCVIISIYNWVEQFDLKQLGLSN